MFQDLEDSENGKHGAHGTGRTHEAEEKISDQEIVQNWFWVNDIFNWDFEIIWVAAFLSHLSHKYFFHYARSIWIKLIWYLQCKLCPIKYNRKCYKSSRGKWCGSRQTGVWAWKPASGPNWGSHRRERTRNSWLALTEWGFYESLGRDPVNQKQPVQAALWHLN